MNLFLFAAVSLLHLVPHPFGLSPIGAIALYAGAYADRRIVWLMPLLPLFIGDAIGGFYDLTVMAFVYAGFALSGLIGRLVLREKRNAGRYAAAVLSSAVVFYLVSNFSIWLVGMYPPTLDGLLHCYINGLPYLKIAVAANAVYAVVLFGLHALFERRLIESASA